MQFHLNQQIGAALCFLPVALVLAIIFRKRKEQRALSHAPFKDLVRRPAGETLRLKLECLEEQLTELTMGLVLFPMMMALVLFALHPIDIFTPVFFFFFSAASSVFFGFRLYNVIRTKANYQLGYEGERFVGEELSRLIALGFEIYHDVPFDGFNIDHVLVGPRGVFIVETKSRRKPVDETGEKKFRVGFDGKYLQWPWGADNYGIEQAKNNAKTLSGWLSSAAGESVWTTPILTLPGWMVDRKVPSDSLFVLNPKEIYGVCSSQAEKLTEPQIKRICHQLDQKCRIEVT